MRCLCGTVPAFSEVGREGAYIYPGAAVHVEVLSVFDGRPATRAPGAISRSYRLPPRS